MYKVFINDKVICFTKNVENVNPFSNGLVLNFFSLSITSFIVDLVYEDDKIETVIVAVDDYESAFNEFKTYFKIINAAGGLVSNNKDKKLFIYRLCKWDLPKGKIEKDEGIEDAAIREVQEETGISGLKITNQLKDTFHIYKLNDRLILKQTYWFDMTSSYDGELIPQMEENITKVEWLTDSEIENKVMKNTYASIRELL
ncbi:MAG: NUDIX hydrolase [Flavobacteriales bacterium]|nr:MAG: NUDIX hydrolase [Flavobacteriales bacterium]